MNTSPSDSEKPPLKLAVKLNDCGEPFGFVSFSIIIVAGLSTISLFVIVQLMTSRGSAVPVHAAEKNGEYSESGISVTE